VIKEVIKEVPKEVVVEKVVIKEVVKIVEVVATPVPAAMAAPAAESPEWVKRGKYGGVLTMNVNRDLRHWDTHQACCNVEGAWGATMFDTMVQIDPVNTTKIICDLCQSWETSKDGLSIIFKMNPKARWWDGKPVTAEDAKYSIDRMMQEGQPRPRTQVLRDYVGSTEVLDEETVKLNFLFPNPSAFMQYFAIDYMTLFPKHVLATSPEPDTWFDDPKKIVGSGPFKFKSWTRGDNAALVRNDNYWKEGRPFVDEIQVFAIKDIGRIIAAFETEQLLKCFKTLACSIKVRDAEALISTMGDRVNVHWAPPSARSININHTKAPFDDVRVRQAIYIAIDRKKATEIEVLGRGLPGVPFPPGTWMSATQDEWATWPGFRYVDGSGQPVIDYMGRDDVVKDPRDIELAKSLLAEAGFADGLDTTLEGQPLFNDLMLSVKEDLEKVGIRAEFLAIDGATNLANLAQGKYNLAASGHNLSVYDPAEMFTCCYLPGGSRNQVGWENPRVSEIYELQKSEPNQGKRREYMAEVEQIIFDEQPSWIPVHWAQTNVMVLNKKVKNYFPPNSNHQAMGQDHLWIEK